MDPLNATTELGSAVTTQATSLLATPEAGLVFFWIFVCLVVMGTLAAVRYALVWHFRKVYSYHRTVFQVLLPKEPEEQAQKEEAIQKKDLKEVIAEAESFYANLIGTARTRDWGYFLYRLKELIRGGHRHLALEIVAHQGRIYFYVIGPKSLEQFIEQQITAFYPTAEVVQVEDYNIFQPTGAIAGTYLQLSRNQILPLKTYKKIDSDPLEGVTNTLSKLGEDEGAAVQILLRPGRPRWHEQALKVVKEMHHGKTLGSALRAEGPIGAAVHFLFSIPWEVGKFLVNSVLGNTQPDKQQSTSLSDTEKLRQAPVRLLKREENLIQAIEEKYSKAYFEVNIRLLASASSLPRAQSILSSLIGSFAQFTDSSTGNKLGERLLWWRSRFVKDFIYRNFRPWRLMVLNAEELASFYHFPLPSTETPNILWLESRRLSPPVNLPTEGLVLGKSVFRGREQLIHILDDDRRRHVYIIGKSGTGKSVLISNMAIQDIRAGRGVCVVDPHGDLIEDILANVPKERADDVVVFNPSDVERPVGLNMLEASSEEEKDFAVQEMISIFYKLFPPEMIGPMFEHNMRNVMLTLMADLKNPGTIAEIPRMFTDPEFQKQWVTKLTDPIVRAFWEKEMAKTSDFHKSEMLGYLISKVGRFVENEMMRNIIGQARSGFDFREIMDQGKILLVNLSKGKTGEVNSNLLGLIIVSKLQMAAMARADMASEARRDFYLYIDEFQNFITPSIATILSEARKYKLNLIIAHQYLGQLSGGGGATDRQGDSQIRDAVLGTTGTMIAFKVGAEDAEVLAKEFAPVVNQFDLVNVERFNAYIKLLIKNQASRPFNLQTLPPVPGNRELGEKIRQLSRLKYGRARAEVQGEILERTQLGDVAKKMIDSDIEPSL